MTLKVGIRYLMRALFFMQTKLLCSCLHKDIKKWWTKKACKGLKYFCIVAQVLHWHQRWKTSTQPKTKQETEHKLKQITVIRTAIRKKFKSRIYYDDHHQQLWNSSVHLCLLMSHWMYSKTVIAHWAQRTGGVGTFQAKKALFHPPQAFNRCLILHHAVQSKCQGIGEEIWSSLESLKTRNQKGMNVTLAVLDYPQIRLSQDVKGTL